MVFDERYLRERDKCQKKALIRNELTRAIILVAEAGLEPTQSTIEREPKKTAKNAKFS